MTGYLTLLNPIVLNNLCCFVASVNKTCNSSNIKINQKKNGQSTTYLFSLNTLFIWPYDFKSMFSELLYFVRKVFLSRFDKKMK